MIIYDGISDVIGNGGYERTYYRRHYPVEGRHYAQCGPFFPDLNSTILMIEGSQPLRSSF